MLDRDGLKDDIDLLNHEPGRARQKFLATLGPSFSPSLYVATSVLWMLAYIVAQHLPVLIINTGIFPLSAFRVEILLAYVEEQTKTSVSSFN